jgi:hypothetical protein
MATYPNGQYLVSTAEARALAAIPTYFADAEITALLAPVQDAIEVYCDRRFMKWVWQEWYAYDRVLMLTQWPVNTILFLGTPVNCVQVVDNVNKYAFDIKQANGTNPTIVPKLTIINGFSLTTKDYLFSTYTTVLDLVNAVQADYGADLTITISTSPTYDFNSMNTLMLRGGTGLNWYGAIRQNVLYRIENETNRELIIPQNVVVQFNALDYWFEVAIMVMWDAGYTTAQVPQGLKFITANIIRDILKISKRDPTLKSETVTNYSWTAFDKSNIAQLINTNYAIMLQPYKLIGC